MHLPLKVLREGHGMLRHASQQKMLSVTRDTWKGLPILRSPDLIQLLTQANKHELYLY